MAKFALPIKSTYVPDWGVWECIREFIQNAKDEEEDKGSSMEISHSGTKLSIWNQGADMDRSVLLLGKTTKDHRSDLRGQFGEGLNLAILAGIREGFEIVIYTQTERWTATLEPSKDYGGEECLTIHTRRLQKRRGGVGVEISGISEEEWVLLRDGSFTFLTDIPDNRIVKVKGSGSLLLEPSRKGNIYSKGVFVAKLDKFEHGYDLERLELDRDRRMVNIWDLQYTLGALFQKALAMRPELLSADVYRMLRDGAEDTRHIHHHATAEMSDMLVEKFSDEHGDEAVAVSSIQESQQVDRVGKKGIVVHEALRTILQSRMGSPEDIVQKGLREVSVNHAWSDLTEAEKANVTAAATALDSVLTRQDESVLSRVEIVDFSDPKLGGTCDIRTGRIRLSRTVLDTVAHCIKILVHEEAHAITEAGDGTHSHQACIEDLWMLIWESK